MTADASITRRLTISVLLLELFCALVLIAAVTLHERGVRFEAFDADLRATANALLGAVQEADGKDGDIRLQIGAMTFPAQAAYRVTADSDNVLGAQGSVPDVPPVSDAVIKRWMDKRPYRFYVLKGERVIDPGGPDFVNHQVTVIYGVPEGRTWHAIFEATRFVAMATLVLLGITALLMSWLIRRFLLPIRELAQEAGMIDAKRWKFQAPASSRRFIELRPLASAIETTVLRLQRSFDQQRRFTSDAAHELKTDLAIIKSSVQLLTMRRRSVEEYETGLKLSVGDIVRLESTVEKMLTLARLEQAPRVTKDHTELAAAVQGAVLLSRPYAELRQIGVTFQGALAESQVALSGDDALLLCANVLMNALQHAREQGSVCVAMTNAQGYVVLRIRDDGPGVSEQDRPFLFDAFYRGDASRSRLSGGTGLGLSISKAICERTGGSIAIANSAEGGAEVRIELPVFRVDSAEP